jgi:hypothetical protein
MRELVFGTLIVAAAGAGAWFIPFGSSAGDYPLTTREAMSRLAAADRRPGKVPFGTLELLVTKPANNILEFAGSGAFAAIECRVELTRADEKSVDAATSCKRAAPVDGAAASAAGEITELGFAEFVDSALDGRPFDDAKFRAQSVGAVFSNLPRMQKDAIRMSREAGEMQREWEQAETSTTQYGDDWGEGAVKADMEPGPR